MLSTKSKYFRKAKRTRKVCENSVTEKPIHTHIFCDTFYSPPGKSRYEQIISTWRKIELLLRFSTNSASY